MNIREEIKKLSAAEKILLVEEIWDDIAQDAFSDLSDEKKKLIDERLEGIKNGTAKFTSMQEIKRKFQSLK